MELNKNKKILVTHNGKFHSDDIFACATLSIFLERKGEEFEVIRTRNEEIIKNGDYVFDVGCIYDKEKNRFDHHQVGGAGKHANGIEYASFGLVWEKFGVEVSGGETEAKTIEDKIVSPIDANDNGINLYKNTIDDVVPYEFHNIVSVFMPTWEEVDLDKDKIFLDLVSFAKKILQREIIKVKNKENDKSAVINIYENMPDKRLVVFDKPYSWKDALAEYSQPLYVIFPREDGSWAVSTVRKEKHSFNNKKDLPFDWAGLRDKELQKITGVSDAVFCHRALFLAVAKTKEGAIKLAELALQN